jgi:hypothetical protein
MALLMSQEGRMSSAWAIENTSKSVGSLARFRIL